MEFPMKVRMVHCIYWGVTGCNFLKMLYFSLWILFDFVLANSVDLDEMPCSAPFHLGLRSFPRYPFRVKRKHILLFDLITSQSTIFQLCQDGSSWVEPVLSKNKCLVQGHNTVTSVRLDPAAPRSRVKHSTTVLPKAFTINNFPCQVILSNAFMLSADFFFKINVFKIFFQEYL